jgi:PAS domain S-box-containing protein
MAPSIRAGIGLDLLNDPALRDDALRARDSGKLTLAGPLELAIGGTGVVGRLPVFLEDSTGHPSFWGFTMVVMRLPGALDQAHLSHLDGEGLAYELWRAQPGSGRKQVILRSSSMPLVNPVVQAVQVPSATWMLSVAPVAGWAQPLRFWGMSVLALVFSLMLGYLAWLLFVLKSHKQLLEARVEQRTAEILMTQRKLRTTLDAIPDLVWLKDAEGVYLGCNPMFERFVGASEADVVGKTDYDFVDKEQADFFRAHDRMAMEAGKPSTNEEWLDFADGGGGLFETVKTPMFDMAGRLVGVLGIARDITARVEAERALRDSQERSQQYLNVAGVMLVALNIAGCVELVNRKGCEMLGVPETDILGKDWFEHFLPERIRNEVRDKFVQMLEGNVTPVEYTENAILIQGGEERIVAWHNALLRDPAGRVKGVLSSGEDITERKRAEQRCATRGSGSNCCSIRWRRPPTAWISRASARLPTAPSCTYWVIRTSGKCWASPPTT